ncbi:hypothetical protein ACOMICROBIO_LMKGKHOH_02178 [Vibrio sp. B1FIG11]|uniref:KAP family P-loop NTPase fold protein n=1 Tax=Vibrio sp. B1FIG11 TaxID=2751177 RepID=UPI001AFAF415|nr:P-loop NTPase fold protein [Vibrio sp. B1FIG11]CAD7806753.1 hypothetical protein ACOMICROBIO_LMKGKHOH_02178 [Vibrio sp. B1FIG11]CAE6902623.1 hypothetical protein ACOMICROBIO_LMKGKHOH_02178 [Vibrio sp. B1FIG11]
MKISVQHQVDRISHDSKYLFGRADYAQNLINLFQNSTTGYVLAIDAEWGQGKTSFIHQLMFDMRLSDNLIPIYFDAFANDYMDDAFLSIGATIHDELKRKYSGSGPAAYRQSEQIKHLKSATKELATELAKLSVDIAVKTATSGVVSQNSLVKFIQKVIKRTTFDTLEVDVDKKFKAYSDAKSTVEAYKQALEGISNNDEKIVFFIDELDRCRPDFAVKVLEKIKHLFDAKNIIFVLSYNKSQLSRIISSVYGVDMDGSVKYLEKFIHIETVLPVLAEDNQGESLGILFDSFISEFSISLIERNIDEKSLKDMFVNLCGVSKLNLNAREIERAFSYVSFCMASLPKNVGDNLVDYFIPASLMRVKSQSLYDQVKFGRFVQSSGEYSWVFEFFLSYYETTLEKTASNVFVVEQFKQACSVIEMFRFPSESEVLDFPHDSSTADRILRNKI